MTFYWTTIVNIALYLISRLIVSWHWNLVSRSLTVIETGATWKLGCGFLFAFYSNYGRICSHLGDI